MPMRRIPPNIDPATGKPVELNPPTGGSWIRDADGGLTPADEATARGAGLWDEPEQAAEPATEAAAPVATASSTPKKLAKE